MPWHIYHGLSACAFRYSKCIYPEPSLLMSCCKRVNPCIGHIRLRQPHPSSVSFKALFPLPLIFQNYPSMPYPQPPVLQMWQYTEPHSLVKGVRSESWSRLCVLDRDVQPRPVCLQQVAIKAALGRVCQANDLPEICGRNLLQNEMEKERRVNRSQVQYKWQIDKFLCLVS